MSGIEIHLPQDPPGAATVVIDRHERRNALDGPTWLEFLDAIQLCEGRPDITAVILTGAEGVFSAGGDIRSDVRAGVGVRRPIGRLAQSHRILTRLRYLDVPTIAAVEGYALGMGFNIAMACDFVVAAQDAYFQAPFVQRGLIPDGGLIRMLVERVGHQRAAPVLLLGRPLQAPMAHDWGLVSELAEPGRALEVGRALGHELSEGPRDAIALTRSLMHVAPESSLEAFLKSERDVATLNYQGPDAQEGLAAFRERRPPSFRRGVGPRSDSAGE